MVARAEGSVGMVALRDGTMGTAHPAATTLNTDAATMRVRSVITTGEADRAGDIIAPTGLRNREDYLLNPVVLWAHNRIAFPPIGLCEWLDVQPSRIVAETRFAQGVPFAEDVFRLYEQQILRGWSIGFVPRKARRIPGPNGQTSLRVEEWDLLEYSAVPIPENPGALTVALQKGLVRDLPLRTWLERIPDDRGGKWWTTGDVLTELVARDEFVHSE
ncbi:MAG: HK97 family phage prohead protease [Bacteroidales bacterium]|nr:HK97 family phage prohead protease [Bacteroidales bacterium]